MAVAAMKVPIITNTPGKRPSYCRRLEGTIETVIPYGFSIVLPKGLKQMLYFPDAQSFLPFVLAALQRAGLDNRMVRLANGLLAIMKDNPTDDKTTVERVRRLIAAP